MTWGVIIHLNASDELDQLPIDIKAKLTRLLDLIEQVGPFPLREPHVKSLGHKLWEMRFSGREGIFRVIYVVFSGTKSRTFTCVPEENSETSNRVSSEKIKGDLDVTMEGI